MDFVITRTSTKWDDDIAKPHSQARTVEAIPVDYRTFKSLEEIRAKLGDDFFNYGSNHREEKGMVARDLDEETIWIITINTLDELLNLIEDVEEEIVIQKAEYREYHLEIEIYDGYRE